MKIFTKTWLLAAFLPAAASAAIVPDPSDDPVTIEINYQNGTTRSHGTSSWKRYWTCTSDDKTGLELDLGFNNLAGKTEGPLEIAPGTAGPCNFTFTLGDGWRIASYSFTATSADSGNKTIAANGQTFTVNTTTPANVSVTLPQGTEPSLVMTGTNNVVVFNDFTVVVAPIDPTDPALVVDEAPAADANCVMTPTNIVGEHFNTFTTWYHLRNGREYLIGATLDNAGTNSENVYSDQYLYCAVKTNAGYALYNKAAGIASPISGAAFTASALTVNGADITPVFAQKFCAVKVNEGRITRTEGTVSNDAWQGQWTSLNEPTVVFSGSKNNMTVTENATNSATRSGDFVLETGSNNAYGDFTWTFSAGMNYVYDFSFLAVKQVPENELYVKVTPNGGSQITLSKYKKRITGSGYDDTRIAYFVENAQNGKGMIMSDVYVTVRRITTSVNSRTPKALFPAEGSKRRIPAIARVFKGEHAGRLVAIYDYRHQGGDIGFNGNISLQMVYSDDNGETWSQPDYCRDAQGNAVTTYPEDMAVANISLANMKTDGNQYWNCAFGDAALVADRESGKLLLMAVGGPNSFWESRYANPNQCARWWSEDGGSTWTAAERCTYEILDLFNGEPQYGQIDGQFIGSGKIMQSRYVKVGDYFRIYAVIASQNNGQGGTTRNYVLFSDDFGHSWAVLGGTDVCPVATGDGDECKTEELPDGSVVIAGRRRTGNRNFNIFRYTDATKGQGAWMGQIVTDMGFGSINACDGEILIVPARDNINGESCYVILQSFPYGGARNYVSIAYKSIRTGQEMANTNMFTTWEGRYRVSHGASLYSTMAWQANNKLAFFWEEGSAISGSYLDFDLEEITDGRYSYQEDQRNALAIQMTEELLGYRSENDSFESRYVGHPVRSKELFDAKVDEYMAKPAYKTYVAANKLQYGSEAILEPVDGGEYRFRSAHDGVYNIANDLYLAANDNNLHSTADGTADNTSFTIREAAVSRSAQSTTFTLQNKGNSTYVPNTIATNNQSQTVTSDENAAGIYKFISDATGHTAISSVNPGSTNYPALHLAANQNIVIWTNGAQASQWYMELVNAPAGYEAPVASEPDYDDYDFNYSENQPTSGCNEVAAARRPNVYFDLQGRAVRNPRRGIFITPDGKKILR